MSDTSNATPALVPSITSTKRLSMVGKPSAASAPGSNAPGGTTSPGPGAVGAVGAATIGVKDVISPGELCGFVDTLLSQLENKFDDMSEQVLSRMNEMSSRIDNLENTIQDLMQSGIESPVPSPSKRG
ncbi:hypothetical protein IAU60_002892 [Kwoniella sp. DSM 27419]